MNEIELREMLHEKGYEDCDLIPIRIGDKTVGIYTIDEEIKEKILSSQSSSLQMFPENSYYTDEGKGILSSMTRQIPVAFSIRKK